MKHTNAYDIRVDFHIKFTNHVAIVASFKRKIIPAIAFQLLRLFNLLHAIFVIHLNMDAWQLPKTNKTKYCVNKFGWFDGLE